MAISDHTEHKAVRHSARVALFCRRGRQPEEAQQLADALGFRDGDRDDRHMCIECSSLQNDGGCFQARRGLIYGASRQLTPVQTLLQRCERFEPQIP